VVAAPARVAARPLLRTFAWASVRECHLRNDSFVNSGSVGIDPEQPVAGRDAVVQMREFRLGSVARTFGGYWLLLALLAATDVYAVLAGKGSVGLVVATLAFGALALSSLTPLLYLLSARVRVTEEGIEVWTFLRQHRGARWDDVVEVYEFDPESFGETLRLYLRLQNGRDVQISNRMPGYGELRDVVRTRAAPAWSERQPSWRKRLLWGG
jgi:hypothetical protein